MADTKEIIRVLGFIHEYFDNHADEQEPDCRKELFRDWSEITLDTIILLKAQEPRVLALDEIHGSMAVWLEDVDKADVILAITESEFYALHGLCRCFITSNNRRIAPLKREYGIRWRAWTSEPTDEQRKNTPWIEGD